MLKNFNDYRFNVILKARQLGISTISAAYVAWFMLFHREKNVLVIATKLSTATNLVKKVKMIFKNLPSWMLIAKIQTDNKQSFELTNGSQVKPEPHQAMLVVQKLCRFSLLTRQRSLTASKSFGRVFTLLCQQGAAVSL